MKLGLATPLLAGLPWLRGVPVHYGGDLDTHGLAALARARRAVPGLRSCLMDVDTLECHRHLAVDEPQPWAGGPPQPL